VEPFSRADVYAGLVTAEALLMAGALAWRRRPDGGMLLVALCLKCLASVGTAAIPWFYYLPEFVNDNLIYHVVGTEIAAEALRGPASTLVEQAAGAFGFQADAISTDRFFRMAALLLVPVHGSLLGSTLLCAALGFWGQVLLYETFRAYYPAQRLMRWWQFGVLLLPSLTFWSAGLGKDALGVLGLGLAVSGGYQAIELGRRRGLVAAAGGLYCLALFRPQTLPALVLALAPWLIAGERRLVQRRLIIGGPLAVGTATLLLLGVIDARFSADAIQSQIAGEIQRSEQRVFAGSNLDAPLAGDVSWPALLRAAPVAVVVVLSRPFPLEIPGALGALAALENVVLLALTVRAVLILASKSGAVVRWRSSPLVLPSLVFVVVFAVTIGLTQTNLGTLSRYRIPLLPFWVAAVIAAERAVGTDERVAEAHGRLVPERTL
jgi:hypothetical protein